MMVRKAKSICIERRTIAGASGYKVYAGFLMVRHMVRDMVRSHNHPFYWSLLWIDLSSQLESLLRSKWSSMVWLMPLPIWETIA